MSDKLKEAYVCKTCGKIGKIEHLCNPATEFKLLNVEPSNCQFCGENIKTPYHMCKGKLQEAEYVCGQCGRIALNEECLCVPEKIN
jgi:predicted RNA-binding Zn-ribbon protein involved in translation (DUF1610 family)